ncbi:MAG: GNAT family N-acetyltransferase [Proteobacteria bacterium]|nr:GNAT family N-acetyltransferase [Pseudomonadota bacterium]
MASPAAYRIEALGKGHDRSHFDCGKPELNRYLRQQARQDADKRVAAPFVLVAGDGDEVFGFFTLCAASIAVAELPAELARKLPRYPNLPVILLGRLACDQRLKGKGQGEFLLMDALRRSRETAGQIGAMAVVVDAKDPEAEGFYLHYGFIRLQTQQARLFLPMQAVDRLFG